MDDLELRAEFGVKPHKSGIAVGAGGYDRPGPGFAPGLQVALRQAFELVAVAHVIGFASTAGFAFAQYSDLEAGAGEQLESGAGLANQTFVVAEAAAGMKQDGGFFARLLRSLLRRRSGKVSAARPKINKLLPRAAIPLRTTKLYAG